MTLGTALILLALTCYAITDVWLDRRRRHAVARANAERAIRLAAIGAALPTITADECEHVRVIPR
jgi:hypothetical protein